METAPQPAAGIAGAAVSPSGQKKLVVVPRTAIAWTTMAVMAMALMVRGGVDKLNYCSSIHR